MLLAAIAPVFVIILAGFLIRRSGVLSEEADSSLMRMYVNLLYPCLISTTIIGNNALHQGVNLWLPPLVGLLTVVVGFGACWAGARLLRIPRGSSTRTFTYITGVYNYAYTAIPIVGSLFGEQALGVLFTFNLGVEVAFWTGTSLIMADRSEVSLWRRLLNAPVITVIIATVLNLLHVRESIPDWLFAAVRMLGGAAIPLALLLCGAIITDFLGDARPSWADAKAFVAACCLRLGVLPLAFLVIAYLLPGTTELKQVLVVQAAMPCGMLPVVLCKHYGGNVGLSVQIVIGTTLLALFTMPHWITFGWKFVGL